ALAGGGVSGDLRGERGRLARALEPGATCRLPCDHVPLAVGQRHDRVVERRLDVGLAERDVLADTATPALRSARSWHLLLGCLLLPGDLHPLVTLSGARVGLGVLTVHREPPAVA